MKNSKEDFQVWRTPYPNQFLHDGEKISPPENWVFVPAGDPGLTRRLKAAGEYWVLVHRRKNRIESLGIWTDGRTVERVERILRMERGSAAYQQKLESSRKSRERKQEAYSSDFRNAVSSFLNFAPRWKELENLLADAVTNHAVPVGSGTVARTERIPVEQRAEAAVIAWMRHQTTGYDHMRIARIKGERREVRRQLAQRSRELLECYRRGAEPSSDDPLWNALNPKKGILNHENSAHK